MSNETISLGSCKTCGAPAQFLDDGTTRHVDINQDEIDRLRVELSAISAAIGSNKYMDPPDGGDVSLADQVRRMRTELEQSEARVRELEEVRSAARALMYWRPEHEVSRDSAVEFMRLENALREALANSEKED